MRIAICDDEKLSADALCSELEKIVSAEKIRCFQSMSLFWQLLEEGSYPDIVFMDIDWKQKESGIDFARHLYRINPDIQVVYVTGFNEKYSQEIFLSECNLCGYLTKPVDTAVLSSLLEKAKKNISSGGEKKLVIHQRNTVHAVPLRKILYVESVAHQLLVHTRDEIIVYYDRLENVKKDLPACFFQCHKSYLVNMNFIQRVNKGEIILQTGESVPISKAHYSETRENYFRYVEGIL